MNREALFCDGTGDYVIPAEPEINEKVVLRFRTAHNDVDEVKLHAGEQIYTLWKMQTTGEFDFYEIEYQLGTEPFRYYFEIKKGTEISYFSRCDLPGRRVLFLYYPAGIFHTGMGKRGGHVSDFCRPFL